MSVNGKTILGLSLYQISFFADNTSYAILNGWIHCTVNEDGFYGA